ncbi:MAG: copper chaperone [Bacteroidetes bacterium]|jgi:copper chaperone CopZ|nr:MAG: copper chaperone [Bacteroidota bacterium]
MKTIILSLTFVFLLAGHGMAQTAESQKTAETTQKSETVKLKVTGLTCAGCASHLYKVLKETKGVVDNSVEYPGDIAVVDYDPRQIQPEKLIAAIEEKTSYKAKLYTEKKDKN